MYLEVGQKRVFACALDWPGWTRSGRNEQQALEALAAAQPRYARVVAAAEMTPPAADDVRVVDRWPGSTMTDFGVPGVIVPSDAEAPSSDETERLVRLVEATWSVFDDVVAHAPAELRKGPRGGGRDRDKIASHVLGAEVAYASALRVKLRQPGHDDREAVSAFRSAIVDGLRTPAADARWPTRYAARRIAWHVLDHVWEIEDRTPEG